MARKEIIFQVNLSNFVNSLSPTTLITLYEGGGSIIVGVKTDDQSDQHRVKFFWKLLTTNIISVIFWESPDPPSLNPLDLYRGVGGL